MAETDFQLRGPGELVGDRQHGMPALRVADLARDREILEQARSDAQALLAADPGLAAPNISCCDEWSWPVTAARSRWATLADARQSERGERDLHAAKNLADFVSDGDRVVYLLSPHAPDGVCPLFCRNHGRRSTEYYVEPVDNQKLFEGAIEGMVGQLDPFSGYIGRRDARQFQQVVLDQRFEGIGIEVAINPKTKQLRVSTPMIGTPAYEAGIQAGDLITKINGHNTAGVPLRQLSERAAGKFGRER